MYVRIMLAVVRKSGYHAGRIFVASIVVAPLGPEANHEQMKRQALEYLICRNHLAESLRTTRQEADSRKVILENGLSLAKMSR
jgi:hypothetical protein